MKVLVAFYSKTGNTLRVAEEISRELRADIEEIVDIKNRKGVFGWLKSGRDSMKRSLTDIKKIEKDPSKYDLVIIGTPIWAWTVCPAVRTYLQMNKFKNVMFFCTCDSGPSKAFEEMEAVGMTPEQTLSVFVKEIKDGSYKNKVKEFCKKV